MGSNLSDPKSLSKVSAVSTTQCDMPDDIWTIEEFEYYDLDRAFYQHINFSRYWYEHWFITLKSSELKKYVLDFSQQGVKLTLRTEIERIKKICALPPERKLNRSLIGKKITTAGIRNALKRHNPVYTWGNNNCQDFVRYFVKNISVWQIDKEIWTFNKYELENEHWSVSLKSSEKMDYVLDFTECGVQFRPRRTAPSGSGPPNPPIRCRKEKFTNQDIEDIKTSYTQKFSWESNNSHTFASWLDERYIGSGLLRKRNP